MKHKKARIALAFSLIMLMLGMMLFPHVSKAYLDTEIILKMNIGSVDGVGRRLILAKDKWDENIVYFDTNFEEGNPYGIYDDQILDVAFDKYGIVHILLPEKYPVWWSYDLTPSLAFREFEIVPNSNDTEGYMHDIESFVYEGEGFEQVLVGYRSTSGQIYPIPSFEVMKEYAELDSSLPAPSYVPGYSPIPGIPGVETWSIETPKPSPIVLPSTPTPIVTPTEEPSEAPAMTPTSPTQAPSVSSSSTSAPSNSTMTTPPNAMVQPTVTPSVSKKLTVKTSKKKGIATYSLCEGDKTLIQYALKKGKLTWKVGKKKGNAKGVKYAGFIKKSQNLFYMDKKGRGYTISSQNGKKKLIIKKSAKKPIYSDKFITRVKTASKSINISNK